MARASPALTDAIARNDALEARAKHRLGRGSDARENVSRLGNCRRREVDQPVHKNGISHKKCASLPAGGEKKAPDPAAGSRDEIFSRET
jgi:hypothetical protein|tara:strand:- start:235 stop:501 length:267 start_codon:yes stop_codon:yes gene_type:complete